jgi:hypothetical protein
VKGVVWRDGILWKLKEKKGWMEKEGVKNHPPLW